MSTVAATRAGVKPTPLTVLSATIPEMLRVFPQWVVWRYVWEPKRRKWTKPPFQPNGRAASSTDPTTWSTFEAVMDAYSSKGWDGIGFVLAAEDPFIGIDLDDAKGKPKTCKILKALNSYVELSPSGNGYHLLVRGRLPGGGIKKGWVEIYDQARYFTVTGHRVKGYPTEPQAAQEAVSRLYRKLVPQQRPVLMKDTGTSTLSDEEVLNKARTANNGAKFRKLWAGKWEGDYPSQSEAEQALCSILAFWTGGDAAQIDRLFRQSKLYRAKWDERHFSDGRTYGQATVQKAVESTEEVYQHKRAESKPAKTPRVISISRLSQLVLPEPRWAFSKILPEGLNLLAGKPKLGKSWLCLQLALAVGTGENLGGFEVAEPGAALYLALEDNERRLQARTLRLQGSSRIEIVGERIILHPLEFETPKDTKVAVEWPRADEGGVEKLERWLDKHPQTRLVIIDTLEKFRPRQIRSNSNVYREDYASTEGLKKLTQERQVSILLVHHTRKANAEDWLDTVSGSTGLTGSVDSTWVLKRSRGKADAVLCITGRDVEEQELALSVDRETGLWRVLGKAADYQRTKEEDEVLAVFKDAPGTALSPAQIARILGLSRGAAKMRLHRYAEKGVLKSEVGGVYVLADRGEGR